MSERSKRRSASETALLVSLGGRLKDLRRERGLTQESLALSIDMDRSFIAEIETGVRNPSTLSLARIAAGLGVPLSALFEGVPANSR